MSARDLRALLALALSLSLIAPSPAANAQAAARMRLARAVYVPPAPSELLPGSQAPASGGVSTWTATTPPGAQGSPAALGYGANVIASLDQPQGMTITTPTRFGFVAWHNPSQAEYDVGVKSNIAYSDVECDGGVAAGGTSVRLTGPMTYNPDTQVIDYNFEVDPANFADGLHECRVTIGPTTGVPVTLQGDWTSAGHAMSKSLFFNTNYNGTLPATTRYVARSGVDDALCGLTVGDPCLTISTAVGQIRLAQPGGDVGGAVVCLGAASAANPHPYGAAAENTNRNAANSYLKISSCGLGKAAVHIAANGAGHIRTKKVWLDDLTVTGVQIEGGPSGLNAILWANNVDFRGLGITHNNSYGFVLFDGGAYQTNVLHTNMKDGTAGSLIRNSVITHVGGDGIRNPSTAINVTFSDSDRYTYATADTTNGSNIVTDVTSTVAGDPFDRLVVGSALKFCGMPDGAVVTAIDPVARTLTSTDNCTSSALDIEILTGLHADVAQFTTGKTLSILYGVVAIDRVPAQGLFNEDIPPADISNIAVVASHFNSQDPIPNAFRVIQLQAPVDNLFFLESTFFGPAQYRDDMVFTANDIVFVDTTCSQALGPHAGVTYMGSTTCD